MNLNNNSFNNEAAQQPVILSSNATQPADFYKWSLNIDDIISDIEHALKGEFWNSEKKEWEQRGIVLCNTRGINYISTIVRSVLGRHVSMSDLTEEDIKRLAYEICENVADVIEDKWREFNIEIAYFDTIVDLIDRMAYSNLCRAKKGGERLFIQAIAPEEKITKSEEGATLVPLFTGGGSGKK